MAARSPTAEGLAVFVAMGQQEVLCQYQAEMSPAAALRIDQVS